MQIEPVNKTMDRGDLMTAEAAERIEDLNRLIDRLYGRGIAPSSWVGTLPGGHRGKPARAATRLLGLFRRNRPGQAVPSEREAVKRGMQQRLHYQPLPGCADDLRFPWFIYWEIHWVLKVTASHLQNGARLLDAGGTMSLFSLYMASLGYEVHSVDLKEHLASAARKTARSMKWNLYSYVMNLEQLDFPEAYFDHAYSICVFEHLDYSVKQNALHGIARCLKPGGILSLTFDYRNPAPGISGYGKDTREINQLSSINDIERTFLKTGYFDVFGNTTFVDNSKSYLKNDFFENTPYTFGALFLRRSNNLYYKWK